MERIGGESDMDIWKETCARTRKRHVYMKWDLCPHEPSCSRRVTCPQNRPKQIERDSHQSTEAYTIKKDLYKKKRPIQSKEAYTIRKDCSTANCIWRVIQSHSPISFELVSLLRNSISYRIGLCATERGKSNVDNWIIDGVLRLEKWRCKCNRLHIKRDPANDPYTFDVKLDLHQPRETCVNQKRPIQSKKTEECQKRPSERSIHIWCQIRPTSTERDVCQSKGTYIMEKRLRNIKRDPANDLCAFEVFPTHLLALSLAYGVATITCSRLLKIRGRFCKEPYKRDDNLQKRPIIWKASSS